VKERKFRINTNKPWFACGRRGRCATAFSLLALMLLPVIVLAEPSGRLDPDDWQWHDTAERRWRRGRSPVETVTDADGTVWRLLPVQHSSDIPLVMSLPQGIAGWQTLNIELRFPPDFPEQMSVCFFVRDWDHYWYQIAVKRPAGADRTAVFHLPLTGEAAAGRWERVGHERPWHMLTAGQIRELGIKLLRDHGAPADYAGVVGVGQAWLSDPVDRAANLQVKEFAFTPTRPQVGEMCEISFAVDGFYANPFDRDEISVTAYIREPDGREKKIPGFYYEGFILKPDGGKGELVPHGRPQFMVRYTPVAAGTHQVRIRLARGNRQVELPTMQFDAAPAAADYQGFVRIDPENTKFFAFDSGKPFVSLGINARATYDQRYRNIVQFSLWQDEGLEQYRRLFRHYAESGIKVVEVWMCSWWLALEWINDAPGNHGVGYMNQHRAWLLDELMQMAEENGIYVLLVLHNHGKFSTFCDSEWQRNPFNARNGGFLADSGEFFTDARAAAATRRYLDYMVARWGYSPNLMAWKLFSEINLTGPHGNFYRTEAMRDWHREAATYLKQTDPNRHLVTTHWSSNYMVINPEIGELPELDFLTTDAYGGSTAGIFNLFDGTWGCAQRYNKPVLITEFGGSPFGDRMGNLIKQVHLANWKGFFAQLSVSPMLWWFALVDEQDLYSDFHAASKFIEGETLRNFSQAPSFYLPGTPVAVETLRAEGRLLAWGFDREYYFADEENLIPRQYSGLEMPVRGLAQGQYQAQFYDCFTGEVIADVELSVPAGRTEVKLAIPPFARDFAVKIQPRAEE
jgi:hypothetical protein